jgi:hypothetical protein
VLGSVVVTAVLELLKVAVVIGVLELDGVNVVDTTVVSLVPLEGEVVSVKGSSRLVLVEE